MRSTRLVVVALVLLAGACSGDGKNAQKATEALDPTSTTAPASETTTTTTPSTTTQQAVTTPTLPLPNTTTTAKPANLTDAKVRLTQVVNLGSNFGPLAIAQRTGDDTLYIAGQRGRVVAVRNGQADPTPVVDMSGEITAGGEQGLLGVAFSSDGNLLYVSYTDRSGDSQLRELPFRDGRADFATGRPILSLADRFSNHNGGQVTFGPDGLLYFFMGDEGSANDPFANAQNLGVWFGKILRIDPRPSPTAPYTVPADNPFVGRAGAKPEIWIYGLRNPWRNSFDQATGDLWVGDVGQNTLEEIDHRPRDAARGTNFGWSAHEGTRTGPHPAPPAEGHVPPVYEYPTSDGCAVTGGYVYRGSRIPDLAGAYVFGDFCNGQLRALRLAGEKVSEQRALGLEVTNLASFGEDHAGELYALSLSGGVFRIDPT